MRGGRSLIFTTDYNVYASEEIDGVSLVKLSLEDQSFWQIENFSAPKFIAVREKVKFLPLINLVEPDETLQRFFPFAIFFLSYRFEGHSKNGCDVKRCSERIQHFPVLMTPPILHGETLEEAVLFVVGEHVEVSVPTHELVDHEAALLLNGTVGSVHAEVLLVDL